MNLIDLNELSFERERIPFIDEGDGLTSEGRESTYDVKPCCPRRWVQDDGRRPQYCLISDARGRLRRLLQVWQMSVPAILLMPRGM